MPTALLTNSTFSNYFTANHRHFVFTYVSVFECISAAPFALGHFSSEWDFVSRAHWLATSLGTAAHLRVLQTERERYCEWWSRLWSDSLVLPSASSHYTANTHTGSVALLVPWIKPDFYSFSWEPANSRCTQLYGCLFRHAFYIYLAVKQFWHDIRRG